MEGDLFNGRTIYGMGDDGRPKGEWMEDRVEGEGAVSVFKSVDEETKRQKRLLYLREGEG